MADYEVQIKQEPRRSLALKLTPQGIQVLIPTYLDASSAPVREFIARGLPRLPASAPPAEGLSRAELQELVATWAARLEVTVHRVQIREMRNKWGSISTAGNLTLARALLRLPRHLVEYVICHELLHLHIPAHSPAYRLLLRRHIPDWRARERELGAWVVGGG